VTVPAPRPPVVASRPAAPRPTLRIDAVAAPAAPPASAPGRLQSAATRPAAPRAAAPSFDLGAPALAAPAAQDTLASTPAPRAAAPARAGTGTRASPRPPASLAVPALASALGDFGLEATPVHVAVRGDAARAVAARAHEPKLRGVPLGSLASCVSDREEDALKQQLVALVGGPAECVSAAGRYRFVETRNLNAFLLWVERAPQRAAADRCVELSFALECVRRRGGGEWKQG
jgi:hypothetical protein